MIQGAKYWDNKKKTYSKQSNNAIETLVPGLEYCGPTAATICDDALTDEKEIKNQYGGNWIPQKEDSLSLFFIDESNWDMFRKIRGDVIYGHKKGAGQYPPNEIPQLYPYAVQQMFGLRGEFRFKALFESVAKELWEGNAVQLCLDKPGHFIAAVAYDEATKEIIYNDPWPERWPDGNGFNRRMGKAEFESNMKNFYIVYYKR
jgi:hypothetical protein